MDEHLHSVRTRVREREFVHSFVHVGVNVPELCVRDRNEDNKEQISDRGFARRFV